MDYGFLEHWHDFLPREAGHMLTVSGAGDMALVLSMLEDFYHDVGLDVTLTSVQVDPNGTEVPKSDPTKQTDGIVICEMDERCGLPLKLSVPGAASWPQTTTLALVLIGAEGVGSPAGTVIWGRGQDNAKPSSLAALPDHELVTWEHLDDLLLAEGGYLDQVPLDIPVALAITGLEEVADSIGMFGFLGRVMQHDRLPLVMFGSRGENGAKFRTAYGIHHDGAAQ